MKKPPNIKYKNKLADAAIMRTKKRKPALKIWINSSAVY